MEEADAALLAAILCHLEDLSARSQDESLDVAVQCLRESSVGGAVQAEPTSKLREVYQTGIAALSQKSATPKSQPSFERFLESLARRGYFQGAPEGSPEYSTRLQAARSKFATRFGVDLHPLMSASSADGGVLAGAAPSAVQNGGQVARPSAVASESDAYALAKPAQNLLESGDFRGVIKEVSRVVDEADCGAEVEATCLAELLGTRSLAYIHTVRCPVPTHPAPPSSPV
jgi:hypothetical protein